MRFTFATEDKSSVANILFQENTMTTKTRPKDRTRKVTKNKEFWASIDGGVPELFQTVKKVGDKWECKGVLGAHHDEKVEFAESDILDFLAGMEKWTESQLAEERFYASLPVGHVLHYYRGGNSFIRCEIVEEDHNGSRRKALKAVAAVGEWTEHDLPHRTPLGDKMVSGDVTRITEGTTFRPAPSQFYESEDFEGKGLASDPTGLEPIDLSLPPMTEDQKEAARLWKLSIKVRDVLNPHEVKGDQYKPATPRRILEAAHKLLAAEFNGKK